MLKKKSTEERTREEQKREHKLKDYEHAYRKKKVYVRHTESK